uniref:Uncharacterized protein n=1 Tax=Oryza brachyantha TaxID=4533 RepID=J3KVC5_ORYBR
MELTLRRNANGAGAIVWVIVSSSSPMVGVLKEVKLKNSWRCSEDGDEEGESAANSGGRRSSLKQRMFPLVVVLEVWVNTRNDNHDTDGSETTQRDHRGATPLSPENPTLAQVVANQTQMINLMFHDLKTNKNNYLSKCSGKGKQTKPSNLQLQLVKTAPHHRHSRRRTEPYFNLRNNLLLTQALALALVGEKLSKAEYKPPYSTSNTQERKNNECNRVQGIG